MTDVTNALDAGLWTFGVLALLFVVGSVIALVAIACSQE